MTSPECPATLDQLEVDPPRAAGVGEARVLFSGDRELRIQHVVRRYPDVGADAAFDDAVATLANCGQFRLTYPDQSVFQVTVAARPIDPIGDEAWSATIDVSTSLVPIGTELVHTT